MAVEQSGCFRSCAERSLNRDQRAALRDALGVDRRVRLRDRALRDGPGKVVNVGFAACGRTDDENLLVAESMFLEALHCRLGVRSIGVQAGNCLRHFTSTLVVRPRKGFRPKLSAATHKRPRDDQSKHRTVFHDQQEHLRVHRVAGQRFANRQKGVQKPNLPMFQCCAEGPQTQELSRLFYGIVRKNSPERSLAEFTWK